MLQFFLLAVATSVLALIVPPEQITATAASPNRTIPYKNPNDGYSGYNRSSFGDPLAVVWDTASSPYGQNKTYPPPDVYLNASVHVGEIDVDVENITAKINLQAQVLNLFKFNAGVDASIDRVFLQIKEVNAHVLLEARLGNLVMMINDVLHSLDLNPVIATLGKDLKKVTNTALGGVGKTVNGLLQPGQQGGQQQGGQQPQNGAGGGGTIQARSVDIDPDYNLVHNVLYSINDYNGHTHTNRILGKSGNIVDVFIDNDGHIHSKHVVGTYETLMHFNGHRRAITQSGHTEIELEYVYQPFPGVNVVSMIYTDTDGKVMDTRVVSEINAGGGSTVSSDDPGPLR